MKKKWFYLAATLLLAGCAEDAFEDTNMQETTERQEIKLSAGTTGISVESRGAGTVGGLNGDASNVWNGQQLIIWGFKNDADLTKVDDQNVKLDGITATAPTNTAKGTIALNGGPHYYPTQGAFHFVGYYIDDAAGTTPTPTRTASSITQAVTIDGSQDIMIAKAELTAANKVALVNALREYGDLTGATDTYINETTGEYITADATTITTIDAEYKKAFSSYAARRGVQPEMTFQHQLARLEFSVIAGDENAKGQTEQITVSQGQFPKGILIKGITVKDAQNQGTITIDKTGSITFTPTENVTGDLTLKDAGAAIGLTQKAPEDVYIKDDANNTYTRIGESILAIPAKSYKVDIETIQYVQIVKNSNPVQYEAVLNDKKEPGKTTPYKDVTIQLPAGQGDFLKGHTYDIKVKVYSNQEIVITATLEGWENGGEVNVSPEDDEWNKNQNTTNP